MRISYNIFRHCVQESWGAELHKDLKVTKEIREKKIDIFWWDFLTWLQNPIGWGTNLKKKNHRLPPFLSAAKDSNLTRFTPLVELFTRESTPTLTLTRRSLTTQNSARQTLRSWSGRRCVAKLTKLTNLKYFSTWLSLQGLHRRLCLWYRHRRVCW